MSQAIEIHTPTADLPTVITPMAMIDRALAMNATPDTLERLLALQERWEANEARKAFDEALAAAKAEMPVILKNRTVSYPHKQGDEKTSYRHEDMGEIARTVDPILGKHGLSYRFRTTSELNQPISVTCIVSHRKGHSEQNTLIAGRDDSGKKNAIQQMGSTITYLQRYTLKAALGLAAAHDDDGKANEPDPRDAEKISPEQVAKVLALAEETKASIPKLCAILKVESIPELTVVQYNLALENLEARRNRK